MGIYEIYEKHRKVGFLAGFETVNHMFVGKIVKLGIGIEPTTSSLPKNSFIDGVAKVDC